MSQRKAPEGYQKEEDGEWRVIHSAWAFVRQMDKPFGRDEDAV